MNASIKGARVIAAHDGVAEMVVTIVYDNGGQTEVTLDATASDALMKNCGANTLTELHGNSWQKVRDALTLSYNRYQ